MQPNNGILYAVIDTVADSIIGGIQMHRSDAAAIRAFGDIAAAEGTVVNKHPEDYELRRLGLITPENTLDWRLEDHGPTAVIITGAQWKAAQQLDHDFNERRKDSDMGRG